MISTSLVLLTVTSSLLVSAYPTPYDNSTSLYTRDEVICGTTQDATLSACQSILDHWTGSLVESNKCRFGGYWRGSNVAYNVASVPGCSVYVTSAGKNAAAVKEAVQTLMGCADRRKGKVNGVTTLADGTFVCIGGNDGCGDCFDDTDIDNLDKRRLSQEAREPVVEPVVETRDLQLEARRADPSKIGTWAAAFASIINGYAGDDNVKRSNGVRNMVRGMVQEFNLNAVACHTEHEAKFDGVEGVDWFHYHFEIDIALGGTIGYELYVGNSGTFKRIGDGSYINWAWKGRLAKDAEDGGSFLTFAKRD